MTNPLTNEPAAVSAAVIAVVNVFALFGVVSVTPDQLAGTNTALVLVLGLFVRQSVTPNSKL